jgi:hypothetical protein
MLSAMALLTENFPLRPGFMRGIGSPRIAVPQVVGTSLLPTLRRRMAKASVMFPRTRRRFAMLGVVFGTVSHDRFSFGKRKRERTTPFVEHLHNIMSRNMIEYLL